MKANVSNKYIFIERIKALISLEEDKDVDYKLEACFDDISLRSCKNAESRLPSSAKGFLVYGRNVTAKSFREILNAFRT